LSKTHVIALKGCGIILGLCCCASLMLNQKSDMSYRLGTKVVGMEVSSWR
jgi:hypothetical protein